MRWLVKPAVSGLLGAGVVMLAYVTLSPGTWSRETFDVFPVGAAVAAGSNIAFEVSFVGSAARPRVSWPLWLVSELAESVAFAGVVVVIAVLLNGSTPAANLASTEQRAVFAVSCVAVTAFAIWLVMSRRQIAEVVDTEQDLRLEAARREARQNVTELMEQLERRSAGAGREAPER